MPTYEGVVRRGLPRKSGGDAWPPASAVNAKASIAPEPEAQPFAGQPAEPTPVRAASPAQRVEVAEPQRPLANGETTTRALRRGLPRMAAGEKWPPEGKVEVAVSAATAPVLAPTAVRITPQTRHQAGAPVPEATAASEAVEAGRGVAESARPVRKGLPRTPYGAPWPEYSVIEPKQAAAEPQEASVAESPASANEKPSALEGELATPGSLQIQQAVSSVTEMPPESTIGRGQQADQAAQSTAMHVSPTAHAKPETRRPLGTGTEAKPAAQPKARAFLSTGTGKAVMGVVGLLVAAALAVLVARWLVGIDGVRAFLVRYPGETHLPEGASLGFPGWVRWQHFLNLFFMVLIIRSGIQIRREQRPAAYWTPGWAKSGQGKISLTTWFHQCLDALWLLNGALFILLMFVTDHWMRIIPTSWEVFPNALSALLQYLSLDWPTENGWVNYNSLQQLMYALTIFIAAPLAAATGFRMSSLWPKNAKRLSQAYPVEVARMLHFPVMLYFVAFVIVHVALVFSTGALRNLNHMYAGQDVMNWTGFWIFLGSLVLIAGAWFAARPFLLAPAASLMGKVSSR
jgi:thiosulfate reductase cytochrome b subunit